MYFRTSIGCCKNPSGQRGPYNSEEEKSLILKGMKDVVLSCTGSCADLCGAVLVQRKV